MNFVFIFYLKVLIEFYGKKTTVTACGISDEVSHDQLTRALNSDRSWQTLLESITKPIGIRGGYLIIDDTVLEKPYGKSFEGASYVYSSAKGKAVFGYSVVLLIWTDGIKRVILREEIYQKGGLSKIELALNMLSYARNRLKIKPDFVLFDSWYGSKQIFKRLNDYGWAFVTRLKKNRLIDGKKLPKFLKTPYASGYGSLTGGLKVFVVRNGTKYFATNRLSLNRCEVLKTYGMRQQIEEVNKQLKHLSLNGCQMRSSKAQNNHVILCIFAYTILEKESRKMGESLYKYRQDIILRKIPFPNTELERLKKAA